MESLKPEVPPPSFPDLHAKAAEWVARTLAEVTGVSSAEAEARAPALVAITEFFRIPVELLIGWIYERVEGKEWSAREYSAYARLKRIELNEEQLLEGKSNVDGL